MLLWPAFVHTVLSVCLPILPFTLELVLQHLVQQLLHRRALAHTNLHTFQHSQVSVFPYLHTCKRGAFGITPTSAQVRG